MDNLNFSNSPKTMKDNTKPTIKSLQAELEKTKEQRNELAAMLGEAVGTENIAAFLKHWNPSQNILDILEEDE